MPIEAGDGRGDSAPFLDIDFSLLPFDGAVEFVRGAAQSEAFSYVVTPNVDHVVRLFPDQPAAYTGAYRAAYEGAALRLCDSRILQGLARFCKIDLPLVPGSDLTRVLFETVFAKGWRIAVIGGSAQTLAQLAARFPEPSYVHHEPPMGVLKNEAARLEIIDFIVREKPMVTLFAIGAPQSEIVAHSAAATPGATGVALCIGASIEFITGEKARAPVWIQKAGLEWAHRLLSEPRRLWKRYLVEGPRIFGLTLRWKSRGAL